MAGVYTTRVFLYGRGSAALHRLPNIFRPYGTIPNSKLSTPNS